MKPLDQTDRDWSKGNCFYITLEFLKDVPGLINDAILAKGADVKLVHGLLDSGRASIKHAWIEVDGVVHDLSNGQTICATKEAYYRDNSAVPKKKFTRAEADALLSHLTAADGELPIGYWGDVSDEMVRSAMIGYSPPRGKFAAGLVFSDPADPANAKNIRTR